jgi:hypothetical protein
VAAAAGLLLRGGECGFPGQRRDLRKDRDLLPRSAALARVLAIRAPGLYCPGARGVAEHDDNAMMCPYEVVAR